MRTIPYEREHLDTLIPDLRERDRSAMNAHGGEVALRKLFDFMQQYSICETYVTDAGEVAAIWMIHEKWKGVYEVHTYTGKAVDRNVREFYLACQRGIEALHTALECHRIDAAVRCDYPQSVAWLEKLGFVVEGTLRKFGADQSDYYQMARIW